MDYKLEELSIEITERCLVECKHCSSGSTATALSRDMRDKFYAAIVEAADMGATTLSLSGGDPVLDNSLESYLRIAVECGYKRILLYTSGIWHVEHNDSGWKSNTTYPYGTRLNRHLIETLDAYKSLGLVVIFSLHSHIKEVNDFIMMPGAYDSIVKDIMFLTERGVTVHVHMVPMKPNITHIGQVRDLCGRIGVKNMSVLRFVPQTRGQLNADQLMYTLEDFALMQIDLDMEMKREHPVTLRIGCPAEFRHAVDVTSVSEAGTGKVKACHAGKDLMLVRPDGSVHPCAAWKSLPSDSNIKDHSLRWIWENSQVFTAIREYSEKRYLEVYGQCWDCVDINSCKCGCPAQKLHAVKHPTLDNMYDPVPDPMCPRRL